MLVEFCLNADFIITPLFEVYGQHLPQEARRNVVAKHSLTMPHCELEVLQLTFSCCDKAHRKIQAILRRGIYAFFRRGLVAFPTDWRIVDIRHVCFRAKE